MLRVTLDQMRSSAGRLAAAGIAILLGTAFVAASLLASATMQQATHDAFTASYADADLVVTTESDPLDATTIEAIRATDGVRAADVHAYLGVEVTGSSATEWVSVSPTPSDPALAVGTLETGREATDDGEIVLAGDVAARIGAEVGDTVQVATGDPSAASEELTVVGLLASSDSFFAMGDGARATADQVAAWTAAASGSDDVYGTVLLALDDGADLDAVRTALAATAGDASIQTVEQIADQMTAQETGSNVTFLVLVLAFAAVALAVASLVITNTFQVLVAQRTRTLALLRCVGASRGQIRRSVLGEAAVLGLLASIAGLALGTGVVMIGVHVLGGLFPSVDALGVTVPFSATVPLVTVAVGVLVTVLAALVPAKMATRVAPVAALRPLEGASEERAGRIRLGFAVGTAVLGAAMLAGGVALALSTAETDNADAGILGGLALGVFGGLFSLTGILVGSVFLVPRLLPLLGRLAGRGVPATIATSNAVRNPRRTAATTNALVIGVALVVMMSTGAFSARQTLMSALDSSFPVDITATSPDPTQPVEESQLDAVTQTAGVAATAEVRMTDQLVFSGADGGYGYTVAAIAPDDAARVLRDPTVLDLLSDDVVMMDAGSSATSILNDGDVVTVTDWNGETIEHDGAPVELTVRYADTGGMIYLTDATLSALQPELATNAIWARIADDADAVDVAASVQTALNDVGVADPSLPVLSVAGAAVERAAYGQVIDTMLAVVLGLLAVAVVIALVGVANTLSLSVLERRRENATLRAIGLTRGQLRGMLAIEGVLIALVGALVGVIAGLLYGWAGASIVLGGIGGGDGVRLGVPWPQLAAVAVVALAAGLLASVLPARSAVRQSPVAALATD